MDSPWSTVKAGDRGSSQARSDKEVDATRRYRRGCHVEGRKGLERETGFEPVKQIIPVV